MSEIETAAISHYWETVKSARDRVRQPGFQIGAYIAETLGTHEPPAGEGVGRDFVNIAIEVAETLGNYLDRVDTPDTSDKYIAFKDDLNRLPPTHKALCRQCLRLGTATITEITASDPKYQGAKLDATDALLVAAQLMVLLA